MLDSFIVEMADTIVKCRKRGEHMGNAMASLGFSGLITGNKNEMDDP